MVKVLNLYSGIGGNRLLWKGVDVMAIENNHDITLIYSDLFPEDNILEDDAHTYLSEKYTEYDFIWSSPPCQSHSRMRQFVGVNAKGYKPLYPDLKLYEEIIFLQYNCKTKWVVENVIPYYEPLIKPTAKIGRHLLWSNFDIEPMEVKSQNLRTRNKIEQVQELHSIDLSKYNIKNKRQLLRNCVDAEIGLHILKNAFPDLTN